MQIVKRMKHNFGRKSNQFENLRGSVNVQGQNYQFYSLGKLNDPRLDTLPYSIRVLLENTLRNNDEFVFTKKTTEAVLDWVKTSQEQVEIPFKPSRVLL